MPWHLVPILSELVTHVQVYSSKLVPRGTCLTSSSLIPSTIAYWTLHRHRRTSSVDDMLTALGWSSLKSRCGGARLSNFYRFHHGLIPMNSKCRPNQKATVRGPCHTHPLSYPVPCCWIDYRKFSFLNTITVWNNLLKDVATAPFLLVFQSQLSKCILRDSPPPPPFFFNFLCTTTPMTKSSEWWSLYREYVSSFL